MRIFIAKHVRSPAVVVSTKKIDHYHTGYVYDEVVVVVK